MARPVDIWTTGTPPDGSIMAVKSGTLIEDTDWRWRNGNWYTGFSSGNIHLAKADQKDAVFAGLNSERKVYLDIVGRPGGPYDRWYFDLQANSWMRPDTAAELAASNPATATQATTGNPKGAPGEPPGIGAATGGPMVQRKAVELTVSEDGRTIWTATTPSASAARNEGNPHSGQSAINTGAWEDASGGAAPSEYGLPKPILAYQPDGTVQPASVEYTTVLRAAQMGDQGALQALQSIGVAV